MKRTFIFRALLFSAVIIAAIFGIRSMIFQDHFSAVVSIAGSAAIVFMLGVGGSVPYKQLLEELEDDEYSPKESWSGMTIFLGVTVAVLLITAGWSYAYTIGVYVDNIVVPDRPVIFLTNLVIKFLLAILSVLFSSWLLYDLGKWTKKILHF